VIQEAPPVSLIRPLSGLLPWQSYFLAFALGILSYRRPMSAMAALLVLVLVDSSIRGWLRRLPVLAFALSAAFGFGYASQLAPEPVETPAWMEARTPVEVRATVDRAEPRQNGRLRLVLRDVVYTLDGEQGALPGKLAWTWRNPRYSPAPGQSVSLPMRVVPLRNFANPGAWDYEWYWQRQGVNWRGWPAGRRAVITWGEPPDSLLWSLKSRLREAVAEHVPDSQGGAMVLALITGDKSKLSETTVKAARSAGLAHTLALSGLHVGFVAAMGLGVAWLAGWCWPSLLLHVPRPKLAVWIAAPLVLGYAWLGQPSQSLIRAATMFAFWGFLLLQGRGRVLMDGLFFALAVIIFVSPFSVFDLSLQMSAVAVAGIGLMFPRLQAACFFGHKWWQRGLSWAVKLLGLSLCANIALLPLVSWNFGTWTPNILLNLVWLPVLGIVVMPFGVAGMLLTVFAWTTPVGSQLLLGASLAMDGLINLLSMADGMTPVFSVLRPSWLEMLGGVVLLVAALLALINKRTFVGMTALGFLLMVWPHAGVMFEDAQDRVVVSFIDVGQGQSTLISTPGGHRWLVDGGAGSSSFDFGESVVAPYLTYGRPPRLDGVLLSHPDSDHSHGIPFILSRFEVGEFYFNGMMPRGRGGKRMHAALLESGLEPRTLRVGTSLELGQGVQLEVKHPPKGFGSRRANERSLVLRLVRDGESLVLLPGDIEQKGISALLEGGQDVRAEVLSLPHHGSRSSHSRSFYAAVAPDVAVCASGYINRYGFPHPEVVRDVGVPVFTNAEHGNVTAIWEHGESLVLRGFRR